MPTLQQLVDSHARIAFFGGAGVSTESGIPDFRSADGLYRQRRAIPAEVLLSHDFFLEHPEEFYAFYRESILQPALLAKPNPAHVALARLERAGKLTGVVTQNIDGLHQAAGSKRVYELHGSVHRNVCQRCGHVYSAEWIMGTTGVPHCEECGGRIKPDVVLYGESLDEKTLIGAAEDIQSCDMLIVGGTSLVVYPAAGLVQYFQGDDLVIVNKQPTPQDGAANLVCACDIAKAFDF